MFFPWRFTHLAVMVLMIVKFVLISFPSLSPSCYSPSVPPTFTSGLSCVSPGAVSICAGEPDHAQEVMDYIQHHCFISIQNCLGLRYRRQLPKLFLCVSGFLPCTAAHIRLTPRKTPTAACYSRKREAVEGPHAAWCADISCANTKMNRVKLLGYVDYRAQRLRFSGQSIELTAADKLRVQMQFNSLESKI